MHLLREDPVRYRENVHKSWKVITSVLEPVLDDCLIAHFNPMVGSEYDCLSLVTRDANGHLDIRFMMNRNGVNANILDRVWDKVDELGVERVADLLIDQSRMARSDSVVTSRASQTAQRVLLWLDEHRDERFFVGPLQWYGACTNLLDIPTQIFSDFLWPFPDHGPELVLGIDDSENMRIMQDSGNVYFKSQDEGSIGMNENEKINDKFFAYIYRDPNSLKVRYVGYATNPSRAFTDGHNERVGEVIAGGKNLEILIAGPYRDEAEARNVEAALVSAIGPELNKIQQPGIKFHPLGVPSELSDRRFLPVLDVHELGRISGGALVVYCDLTTSREDGAPKVSPTNFADDVVYANIQDHWKVNTFIQGWIDRPETSPRLLIAVQGPPRDRIVIGSALIDPTGWSTTPTAPKNKNLYRIPLDYSAGLDNDGMRGRRVTMRFNTGPSNYIMYVDEMGLVIHGYKLKGKSSS